MRFKDSSRARWRNAGVLDLLGGVYVVWPHCRKITGDVDVDGTLLAGGRIEHVNRAKLLIDDRVRPCRCRFDIHTVARQCFFHLFCAGVIDIQIHRAIAVGEEINLITDPHGRRIIRILSWDLFYAGVGKLGDPDGRSRAAAIVLQPAVELPRFPEIREWHIGEMRAVR